MLNDTSLYTKSLLAFGGRILSYNVSLPLSGNTEMCPPVYYIKQNKNKSNKSEASNSCVFQFREWLLQSVGKVGIECVLLRLGVVLSTLNRKLSPSI